MDPKSAEAVPMKAASFAMERNVGLGFNDSTWIGNSQPRVFTEAGLRSLPSKVIPVTLVMSITQNP